ADAIAYAREIGVEHLVEHITPNHALDMLDDVMAACGEPFTDYSLFPTLLVSRLARQQVKVILSGDGGDELFWGYAGRFASVLEKVADFSTSTSHRDPRRPRSIGDFYRLKHSRFPEAWLQRIFPAPPEWPPGCSLFTYTGWEPDRTAQWLRWNEFVCHLTMVLLKVDRASMYHSLEVRVPLLDREVIEIAARVDWRSCLDVERKIGKLPLRHALARHVRHQTWSKRGFTVPMDVWLRGPLRPVFEDVVLGKKEIVGLPINTKAAREMLDQHLSEQANHTWGLWVLLSLALWEERYRSRRTVATNLPT
ncbi:MAG: asparagine synthetase B family protein, partial [Candidatus Binatia bacterium]